MNLSASSPKWSWICFPTKVKLQNWYVLHLQITFLAIQTRPNSDEMTNKQKRRSDPSRSRHIKKRAGREPFPMDRGVCCCTLPRATTKWDKDSGRESTAILLTSLVENRKRKVMISIKITNVKLWYHEKLPTQDYHINGSDRNIPLNERIPNIRQQLI